MMTRGGRGVVFVEEEERGSSHLLEREIISSDRHVQLRLSHNYKYYPLSGARGIMPNHRAHSAEQGFKSSAFSPHSLAANPPLSHAVDPPACFESIRFCSSHISRPGLDGPLSALEHVRSQRLGRADCGR